MELDEIKDLIELLKDSDITELQVEKEGSKLKIKREKFLTSFEPSAMVSKPAAAPAEAKTETADDPKLNTINSPIVGIFFSAQSPESPPFVSVGTRVTKGQVLCIVEAMKLMNEIESDVDGTISKILIENGQPVEYGEPLFLVDPS